MLLLVLLLFSTITLSIADATVHYVVDNDGGQACPRGQSCYSLSYYTSKPDQFFTSNTEFVFLEGTHTFDQKDAVVISYVNNMSLVGQSHWVQGSEVIVNHSNVVINCTHGTGGLYFYYSNAIKIQGLTFKHCGIPDKTGNDPTIHTVFTNIILSHISIQYSKGDGLLAVDCQDVQVYNSSFAFTGRNNSNCNSNTSNAVFMYFSCCFDDKPTKLVVHDSNFTTGCVNSKYGDGMWFYAVKSRVSVDLRNVVVYNSSVSVQVHSESNAIIGVDNLQLFKAESNLCALYIWIADSEANVVVQNLKAYTNSAKRVVTLNFSGEKHVNFSLINSFISGQNCNCVNRIDTGKDISVQMTLAGKNNSIHLLNNTFAHLQSLVGLKIVELSKTSQDSHITIRDCRFTHNIVSNTVLTLAISSMVEIVSSIFSNNSNGLAVIASLFERPLNISIENSTISDNNMTGVMIVGGTIVRFRGYNVIQRNKNIQGAGITMFQSSYMIVEGTLAMYNNMADGIGGAIMQRSQFIPSIKGVLAPCTVMFKGNSSKIILSGNRAAKSGSDMYGVLLVYCNKQPESLLKYNYIEKITNTSGYFQAPSEHLQFSNTDRISSMSSEPIMACFCNSSDLPDCTRRTQYYPDIYPGEEVITKVATIGYYGGTSPGIVQVNIKNAQLIRPYGPQGTTKNCLQLHLLLNSTAPTSALLAMSLVGGLPGWDLSLHVNITQCPSGFYKEPSSGKCVCAPQLSRYNVSCKINRNGSNFQRSGNNWVAYLNDSGHTCITGFTNCPLNYCNRSLLLFDIDQPDGQCVGNRTGVLCGECRPGLSLLLGSNSCGHCTNTYLFMFFVFAVAGILLVAVITAINLTVSVGTINGLLLYANFVKLNEPFFFPNGPVPVVSQFISWINLDLGIEVCFFDGLDGYWRTWLQFVFSGYLLILIVTIIIGCRYSVLLSRLCGSNAVPVLATLFLMSYTKMLRTVTQALSVSKLVCNGSVLRVWSVDGNINYLSGKHIPLVVFSSCVLVVGVAYPIMLLAAPLLEKYSDKCFTQQQNIVVKLKPLLDAYGGPYKDRCRFWPGVSMLVRLVVTIAFSFTSANFLFINPYVINAVVIGIFFVWFFTRGVYKAMYLNVLEAVFLLNLAILSSTSSAIFQSDSTIDIGNSSAYYQEIAAIASVSISLFIFTIIILLHLWWNCNLKNLKKRLGIKLPQNHLHVDTSVQVDIQEGSEQDYPGSPPSIIYNSERGEHQFELFFAEFEPTNNDVNSPDILSPVIVERTREPLIFENN